MSLTRGSAVDIAVEVLAASFADDALVLWLVPGSGAELFRRHAAASAAAGELDLVDDSAAAVWLSVPGGEQTVDAGRAGVWNV